LTNQLPAMVNCRTCGNTSMVRVDDRSAPPSEFICPICHERQPISGIEKSKQTFVVLGLDVAGLFDPLGHVVFEKHLGPDSPESAVVRAHAIAAEHADHNVKEYWLLEEKQGALGMRIPTSRA
jgi:hypothetical protein